MKQQSHVNAIVATREHLLYRVNGKHSDQSYWSYVLIHAHKFSGFKQALAKGSVHAQNFGRVLIWGYGEQPDDASKRMLEREYGFVLTA